MIQQLLTLPLNSLDALSKVKIFTDLLLELTRHHYASCPPYKKLLDALNVDIDGITKYSEIPFLPVSLFKEYDLKSVPDDQIIKTMTSSGTTGQRVSKIYLDKNTAALQTKVLTKIVASVIGSSRLPMIILDSASVVKDRTLFSARGAGIIGFSMFGRDKIFALNQDMTLDIAALKAFLEVHAGKKILLFGFTFMIWQYFYQALKASGEHIDLSNGILIHGGGWKKIADLAISQELFKSALSAVCNLKEVFDYYGMVEQTGSIYLECNQGYLHTNELNEVIVRRPHNFSEAEVGEKGLIQTLSLLPMSYPGHSLLTEDEGIIFGEDNCPCGRKGKYFKVLGRIKSAELRGCSDTYGGVH